jgi:signal transduction histidine kinase
MKLRVKFSLLIGLVVVGALGTTAYLTASFQDKLVIGQAERQARMLSRQILLTRRWVTDHDGLFVTKKPGTGGSPSPAGGDVVDQSGQVYVKRNPGMIIWDLSDYAAQADFCRFRVTSLRPVDPANTPDAFERRGLLDFETGKEEVSEISRGKQGRTLRYMIPLKVEESCLPCHAEHGYQVGNIRGGLSLEVPLGWADEAISANNQLLLLVGLVSVALAGLVVFLLINSLVVRRLAGLAEVMDLYPQPGPLEQLPAGDDEIGELTGKFSGMGERLARSQAELILIREQLFQNEKQAAICLLAASIAHEVNNPIGSMRESLEILGDDPKERELRDRCLDLLDIGLLRFAHVVRQLQNFGQETSLNPEVIDIDGMLRKCFELLAFPLRNIRLKLDLAVADRCLLDGVMLKQVMINIALNAIQAMPDGGELLVTSREEPGLVVIKVRNSGLGIPPGDLDRASEPFATSRAEGSGRGLSLAVVSDLIKRMGGQVRVESWPGDGSLFTIELPRPPSGPGPA